MFIIRNFVSAVKKHDGSSKIVHGFYKDSFAALYGLDAHSIDEECTYINTNTDFLISLLVAATKGFEDKIRFFYDVRTSEEFGQTSPDYAILAGAGLHKVSPLCIKSSNNTALLIAIQIALLDIDNEPALFCYSDLPTRYDRNFCGLMSASAFLLFRKM